MPSIADIPPDLLQADKEAEFIKYMNSLPLAINHKCQLVHGWLLETGRIWTQTQWQQITVTSTNSAPPGAGV
jgi:hypothetical protein